MVPGLCLLSSPGAPLGCDQGQTKSDRGREDRGRVKHRLRAQNFPPGSRLQNGGSFPTLQQGRESWGPARTSGIQRSSLTNSYHIPFVTCTSKKQPRNKPRSERMSILSLSLEILSSSISRPTAEEPHTANARQGRTQHRTRQPSTWRDRRRG